MAYTVDKGVPMVKARNPESLAVKIRSMEIGDSIAVPVSDKRAKSLSANLRMRAKEDGLDYKFAQRKSETEMRVWRIA